MKKGYYRAMVALLAAPLISAALSGCNSDKGGKVESLYSSVEIINKDALTAEWHVGDGARTVEMKVTKKDGTVLEGMDLDDLLGSTLVVTSSNLSVIEVGNDNMLLIVGVGKSTITAKIDDNTTDSIEITVLEYVDPIQNKPTRVTTPVVNKAYKLGIEQYGLSTPSMIYLKGKELVNYYWQSSTVFSEGVDVTVVEAATPNGDYKYNLKVTEGAETWYIGFASSGTHVNDSVETTPTTLWKWDAEHETFLTYGENSDKGNGDYYLGTYGTYNTFSLSFAETNISKDTSYPAHLYEIPEVMVVTNTEITLINGVKEAEKINVAKPQGELSFVKKSGDDCVTIGADGTLTAKANGSCVITVSDTKTSIDVNVTVRDAVKGETVENPLTASEAYDIADGLTSGTSTDFYYYVSGVLADNPTADYCNFHLTDDGKANDKSFLVYGLTAAGDTTDKYGTKRQISAIPFAAGDSMVIYTNFKRYNSDRETGNAKLISFLPGEVSVTSSGEHATVTFTEGVTAGKATNGSTVKFTVSVEEGYTATSVKVYGAALTPVDDVYSFVVKGAAEIVVVTKAAGVQETILEKTIALDVSTANYVTADPDDTDYASTYGTDVAELFTIKFKKNTCSNSSGYVRLNKNVTQIYSKAEMDLSIKNPSGKVAKIRTISLVTDGTKDATVAGTVFNDATNISVSLEDLDITSFAIVASGSAQVKVKSITIGYVLLDA